MAYVRTIWQDEVDEFNDRFSETVNSDGTITHTKVRGNVTQVGTPVNAVNLNKMEQGIFDANVMADNIMQTMAPGNEILYDDLGHPNFMVKIPKATYAQLGISDSTSTFPAFIVNGQEVDYIWISKYENTIVDNVAYSLPGVDPGVATFEGALSACAAKGSGWHLMTAFEWGMLIAWCELNGYIPIGNNNEGKHTSENAYKALPAQGHNSSRWATRVLTGTGPATWYHDKSFAGISDLAGNLEECIGGIRMYKGELQILENNNAADANNSQAADSTAWKAIKSDGTLLTPNGIGTTTGSLKLDWASSALKFNNAITDTSRGSHSCEFSSISTSASGAVEILRGLGVLPLADSIISTGNSISFNNSNSYERMFVRGSKAILGTNRGFASFAPGYRNSNSEKYGFRCAYIELPAA